ncbi:MAG TPA: hypothetical protein VFE84_11755 [Patescibacteria group bacterium]|jgi:hypothetical protein|nr:hypothetical protein [Patescibacteria group bacterium]
MRRALQASLFVLMAAMLLVAWHRSAPRATPAGQPPLATLGPGDLAPVREIFNASAGDVRILLMLSPT